MSFQVVRYDLSRTDCVLSRSRRPWPNLPLDTKNTWLVLGNHSLGTRTGLLRVSSVLRLIVAFDIKLTPVLHADWTWSNITFHGAHQWRSCFTVTALFNVRPSIRLSPLNKLIVLMCQNRSREASCLLLLSQLLLFSPLCSPDLWPCCLLERNTLISFWLHQHLF